MNRNIKTAAKLAALAGAFALTGCAFVPDTVHPQYIPQANVQKIPGADKVAVDVVVKNEKKHHNEISVTKNGYGMKMAGVYMHVAKDFKTAIDKALQARGFKTGPNGNVTVDVVVKKFFLPEQMHWWSITHTGTSNIQVNVIHHGKAYYSHSFIINNMNSKIVGDFSHPSLSADRHKSSSKLLDLSVEQIVNNRSFLSVLMQ